MTSSKLSQATSSTDEPPLLPFLKWPGGKRWLAGRIVKLVRGSVRGTYYEPFLGGGAVFFRLRPKYAVLSDVNEDLVNTYRIVREHPRTILKAIKAIPVSRVDYDRIRDSEPADPFERAVRFLYLNRTAFGGMYRLNRFGKFNVPYGGDRTPEALWRDGLIESASTALATAELRAGDFEAVMNHAGAGDVVYCDPTYTVAHNNNGFIRYNERNFAWRDQERLAQVARRARERGATVVVSNADHTSIRDLYPGAECHLIERLSQVSKDPSKRRSVFECVFILRPNML